MAFLIIKRRGFVTFLKETRRYIIKILYYPYCLYSLTKYETRDDLEELLNFAFSRFGGLLRPLQEKAEILELLKILKEKKPRFILEIGTAHGGTLFLLTSIAAEDACIISVDLPGAMFGGGYPAWKMPLYKSFALPKQKLCLLRADSHKTESLNRIKEILGDNKFDFIFIDADHTYEGVKRDFTMYSPLVGKGGIVALHDIEPNPGTMYGVNKFWEEIKSGFEHTSIVKDRKSDINFGIGMLKF